MGRISMAGEQDELISELNSHLLGIKEQAELIDQIGNTLLLGMVPHIMATLTNALKTAIALDILIEKEGRDY